MSEQYPLLSDELAEQDPPSPRYRRLLMSRERAKNHVKGAAAIITRWPRHWTSLLAYWWVGIGMLALSTYIIYNSIFFYMAQSYKLHRTPISLVLPTNPSTPSKLTVPPKVLMHIFIDEKQEINLDDYLPYIDIVTNKYRHLKFELIFVHNDIFVQLKKLNDKDRNELALEGLWDDNYIKDLEKHNDNLKIKYKTLSMYFYDTPMKKNWKKLNPELQKFLVRALSVWQKGGISFDPIVLTPQSPNSLYIEKVYSILRKYNPKKSKVSQKTHKVYKKPIQKTSKPKQSMPNNIRDIINALEDKSMTDKSISEPLVADENQVFSTILQERKTRSPVEFNVTMSEHTNADPVNQSIIQKQDKPSNNHKYNLLPMFLEYLFHNKQTKPSDETSTIAEINQVNMTEITQRNNKSELLPAKDMWKQIVEQNKNKPVVISAKSITDKAKENPNNKTDKVLDDFEVTVDLKGNIIATDTVCHAFIGNMFSNIIHYNETESVSDFIIKELSSFCKGLLASCVGIDVILL